MEQAKIEQLAFLYLCSEHDKRLLLKKEKMQLADFDRLTYLIYHLGFKEYHIKVWMEFTGDFKKEWECLNALRETGGSVGNIGSTKSEIRLRSFLLLLQQIVYTLRLRKFRHRRSGYCFSLFRLLSEVSW